MNQNERFDWECAMNVYAEFYGEWNDYFCGWKWQKLVSAARWAANYLERERYGAHRALNDCRNTLLILRALAQYEPPLPKEPPPKELPSVVNGPDFDEDVPF